MTSSPRMSPCGCADKQSILDELRPVQRLNKINRLLHREVEILEMGKTSSAGSGGHDRTEGRLPRNSCSDQEN